MTLSHEKFPRWFKSEFLVFDANPSFLEAVTLSRRLELAEYLDEYGLRSHKYNVTTEDIDGSVKMVNGITQKYWLFAKRR